MTGLSPEECWEVLEQGTVAHVAVLDDGEPYVTPLSYVVVGGRLAFRSAPGRRAAAIAAAPRVCIDGTLVEGSAWRSVLVWGDARVADDPELHAEVVAALLAKYPEETAPGFSSPAPFPEERHVVVVTPMEMTGRSSAADPPVRPGRL